MTPEQLSAIDDIETLRALVSEKLDEIASREAAHAAQLRAKDEMLASRQHLIDTLTTEISRLRRLQYSARTETMDSLQRDLFEETLATEIAALEAQVEAAQEAGRDPVKPRTRKAPPVRKPLSEHLPRETTVHEPASCTCPNCAGNLVRIGEHVSEKLATRPLVFFVERHVYPQYACRGCEAVVAEPVAAAIIDRGQAAPSLLAQVVIAKYTDHLPLYRQQAQYLRSGVELARSTLAEWVGAVGVALQPLVDRLREQLLLQPTLHADETRVATLDPRSGKTKGSYLF